MKSRTMFLVRDVEASGRWYAQLLDAETPHGGSEFEMIVKEGEVLLYLHHADPKGHPALSVPTGNAGAGVLLYLYVPDVDATYRRAREMDADLVDAPHQNELARQYEFSLRDPDGYALTVCKR